MTLVAAWGRAFALTLAVEAIVAVPLLARGDVSRLRGLAAVLVANLASHPIVWFVLPALAFPSDGARVVASEAWAVGVEVLVYALAVPRLGALGALGVSALANGASFAVGLVVRATLGFV